MGEMADMANDYQAATLVQADRHINGEMTLEESYDAGLIDELGAEQFPEDFLD